MSSLIPPLDSGVIELLTHLKCALLKRSGIKELIHGISRTLVPNLFVVRAISQQHFFIVAEKFGRIGEALVPQQYQPSAGLQNANKLAPRLRTVEPVRGLRRRDEVHAMIRQRSRL